MIATTTTTTTVGKTQVCRRSTAHARGAAAVVRAERTQVGAVVLAATMMVAPIANAAPVEFAQVAKGDAKSLAAAQFEELQAKKNTPVLASKTKKLAGGPSFSAPSISLPSFSAPSISLPSFGGSKAAPAAAKAAPAPKAAKAAGEGSNLGLILLVLFSPLAVVQAVSFQTLARIATTKK
jgi:hypothetical protein